MAVLSLGSMVVQLDLDGAEFVRNTGMARKALRGVGDDFALTQRQAAGFAREGLGAISDVSPVAARVLSDLATKSALLGTVLNLAGQAAIVLAGAFAVSKLVEETEHWIRFGETVSATIDRLKEEADAQKAFAAERRTAVVALTTFESQLAAARSARAQTELKAFGDEEGAASAALAGTLAALEAEQQARRRTIIETIAMGARRDQALTAGEALHLEKRRGAIAQHHAVVEAIRQADLVKATATFAAETNALLDSIQRRVELRKQIEQRAIGAAERQGLGDLFSPFTQVERAKQDMQAVAEGFALMLDQGVPLRDALEKILEVDQEFAARGFHGFRAAVEDARGRMRDLQLDTFGIDQAVATVAMRIGDDLPAAISRTDPALVLLINRFALIKGWADAARDSVIALEQALAG